MLLKEWLIFVILVQTVMCLPPINRWKENYFCKFKCKDKHIVCRRHGCKPSKKCGRNVKSTLTNGERFLLLNVHNKLRSIIASGQDTRNGNSIASNMNVLSYSMELEYVAQCWANACEYSHDKCRTTHQFEYPGQNIYEKEGLGDFSGKDYLRLALQTWFDEIIFVNDVVLRNYSDHESLYYREFTQMLWAKTTHVGCGRLFRARSLKNFIFLVCNYGPRANTINEQVYDKGEICSKCPTDMPCDRQSDYPTLCGAGTMTTWEDDPWEPPFQLGSTFRTNSLIVAALVFLVLSL